MKIGEIFPSRWLKAEDFQEGETKVVTITGVQNETLGEGAKAEIKPVITFAELKPMVMNKTNANAIAKLHGDDTDMWIGKRIGLFAMEVDAFGEIQLAIRVKPRIPVDNAAPVNGIQPNAPITQPMSVQPITGAQKAEIVKQAQITFGDDYQAKTREMLPAGGINAMTADDAARLIDKLRNMQQSLVPAGMEDDGLEDDPFA